MKYLIILIMLILSVGCGSSKLKVSVAPEFQQYYNDFFGVIGFENEVTGSLVFADLAYRIAGRCVPSDDGYTVQIDHAYWFSNPDDTVMIEYRRLLIYHEMSHCVLNAVHSSDPHNYMYYMLNGPFNKPDLDSQLLTLFKAHKLQSENK